MKNILIIGAGVVLVALGIGLVVIFSSSGSGTGTGISAWFPSSGSSNGGSGGTIGDTSGTETGTQGSTGTGTSGSSGTTGSGGTSQGTSGGSSGGGTSGGSSGAGGTGTGTGTSGSQGTGGTSSGGTMTVASSGGSGPITVNDFVHNGTTAADVVNPGNYYLAGSVGYCMNDGTCPSGVPEKDFISMYNSSVQEFTITLTQEPIGEARMHAEQFMMKTLGLSQQQMCSLKYYLSTTSYVNGTFGGDSLGFSFCPGATALPQ